MNMVDFEKWKVIDCYDIAKNIYEISTFGNIRFINGKELNQIKVWGYKAINLKTENGWKQFRVHRLVLETFNMIKFDYLNIANHLDCNKSNNYYMNLEWTDCKGNTRYAIQNQARTLVDKMDYTPRDIDSYDMTVAGENNIRATFTNAQIHSICKQMEQSIPYTQILENIGLEPTKKRLDIITKIRTKKLWTIISDQYDIPLKEARDKFALYSDEDIHKICRLLEKGYSNIEIAKEFNIDTSILKERDKFTHMVSRIRDRKTYSRISKDYNW